jgi:hypothetical protein
MDAYATTKVKQVLAAAGGNATQAHRILAQLINDDDRLLRGLSGPFMSGIIAHAIQRCGGGKVLPAKAAAPQKLTGDALDKILARMARAEGQVAEPAEAAKPPETVRDAVEMRRTEQEARTPAGTDHKSSLKIIAGAFKGTKKSS